MKVDVSPDELLAMLAFEAEWDPTLGGQGTRPYRELAAYCIGRMLSCGAELHEVLVYLQTVAQRWHQSTPAPSTEGRSS